MTLAYTFGATTYARKNKTLEIKNWEKLILTESVYSVDSIAQKREKITTISFQLFKSISKKRT